LIAPLFIRGINLVIITVHYLFNQATPPQRTGLLHLLFKEYGKQIVRIHGGNELSFWAGDFFLTASGTWGGSQERKRQLP
jgi:hypothetical protein